MYSRDHSIRRFNQTEQTIQIRLREGDRHVRPFQPHVHDTHLLGVGTHISRNSPTSQRNAYTLQTVYPTFNLMFHAETSLAYRGHARIFLKDLEAIRPSAIIDIIHSGESFVLEQSLRSGMKAMSELFVFD